MNVTVFATVTVECRWVIDTSTPARAVELAVQRAHSRIGPGATVTDLRAVVADGPTLCPDAETAAGLALGQKPAIRLVDAHPPVQPRSFHGRVICSAHGSYRVLGCRECDEIDRQV
jgi:hypothetical protein